MIIDNFSGNYHWLSNFYLADIQVGDLTFPSTEHYFMWNKKTSHPSGEYEKILEMSPRQVKAWGRALDLRPDWEEVKDDVMFIALFAKFTQHPHLKERLLKTGDATLVEGNWWHDNYWGDCTCYKRPMSKMTSQRDECRAPGKNMLGTLLMRVRDTIA